MDAKREDRGLPFCSLSSLLLQRHIMLRRGVALRLNRLRGRGGRSRWHLDHRRFRQLQGRGGIIPNLLGQRHVAVQLLAVARHDLVDTGLPLRRVKLRREHLLEHIEGDRRSGGSPGDAPSSAEMVFC